jgi:hypothetical protein
MEAPLPTIMLISIRLHGCDRIPTVEATLYRRHQLRVLTMLLPGVELLSS